jgi:hypothetical protein
MNFKKSKRERDSSEREKEAPPFKKSKVGNAQTVRFSSIVNFEHLSEPRGM